MMMALVEAATTADGGIGSYHGRIGSGGSSSSDGGSGGGSGVNMGGGSGSINIFPQFYKGNICNMNMRR